MDNMENKKKKPSTSKEVRMKWEKNNYRKYTVRFRFDTDEDMIKYVEEMNEIGVGTTELFRLALKEYIENNQYK